MKRIFAFTLSLSLLLGCLSGCGKENEPTPTASAADPGSVEASAAPTGSGSKDIVIGQSSTWGSLMLLSETDGAWMNVEDCLFETLVQVGTEIYYRAAESIDVLEDGYKWTIHLNPNCKWTDGEPCTAEDWVWTLETLTDPDFGVYESTYYMAQMQGTSDTGLREEGQELGVEYVDEYTFNIYWKTPMAVVTFTGTSSYFYRAMPKHLLEDIPVSELGDHDFWNHPVGNGCCTFVDEPVKGEQIVLKANPDFYLGAPSFENLTFIVVSQANAANALLNGEIDNYYPSVTTEVRQQIDGQNGIHFEVDPACRQLTSIAINNERFNTNVRKAFDLLIDKDIIGQAMCGDDYEVAGDPLLSTQDYFMEYTHTRDVETAVAMLEAEGFDFENTVIKLGCSESRQNMAAIIQQMLAEGGVKCDILVSTTTFADQMSGELDACLVSNNTKFSPTAHSARFAPVTGTMTHTDDDTIKVLSDKIDFCQDEAEKLELIHELQQIYWDTCPWIFLYTTSNYIVHSARLSGVRDIGNRAYTWVVS